MQDRVWLSSAKSLLFYTHSRRKLCQIFIKISSIGKARGILSYDSSWCLQPIEGSQGHYFQLFTGCACPVIGLTLTGAGSAGVSGTSAGSVRMLISMTLRPRSMGSVRRRPRFVQTLIDKSVILKTCMPTTVLSFRDKCKHLSKSERAIKVFLYSFTC